MLVRDVEIGGARLPRHAQAPGQVDAELGAGGRDPLGVEIVAQDGDHARVEAEQRHVVGDVPPHAAEAHPHAAGVGVRRAQRRVRPAADVHVHAPDDHRVGRGGQDVALAGDIALFHHVGDVDAHRGPGDARLLRQLLLGDHRVFLDPAKDLPLALGHALTFCKEIFIP